MSTKNKNRMSTQPGRSEVSHAVAGPCRMQLHTVSGDTSIMETGYQDITPEMNHLKITTTEVAASSSNCRIPGRPFPSVFLLQTPVGLYVQVTGLTS